MNESDLSTLLIALFEKLDGVDHKIYSGRANFTINDKIFAFTRKEGIALKLPAAQIDQLIADGRISARLVMGKRAMNEWAILTRSTAAEYKRELPLLLASKAFVESEAAKPKAKRSAAKKTPAKRTAR
jgi:hypothetical protein